jgi:ADP-heptose:LPS heptosyltransferase
MSSARTFLLDHPRRALGDNVCLTALVRDIALTYPDATIGVRSDLPEIWANNPFVKQFEPDSIPGLERVVLDYVKVQKNARFGETQPCHLVRAFHLDFQAQTGLEVPLLVPRPNIHLSYDEITNRPMSEPYWVVIAGGKLDFTVKHWVQTRFQEVIDRYPDRRVKFVQLGGVSDASCQHRHIALPGAVDQIGRTTIRDLFRWIWHAQGVLCGVTGAMHIAAALEKPCVVLAGGREDRWWGAYTNEHAGFGNLASGMVTQPHRFLDTIGKLPCCESKGCWVRSVTKPAPADKLCVWPVVQPDQQVVAKCQDILTVDEVLTAMVGALDPTPEDHGLTAGRSSPVELLRTGEIRIQPTGIRTPLRFKSSDAPKMTPPPTAVLAAVPLPVSARRPRVTGTGDDVFDDPAIGGQLTIAIYATGDVPHIAKRCIDSIISKTTGGRYNLKILAGNVSPSTRTYLESVPYGTVVFADGQDGAKYRMMRRLLADPSVSPWLVWFDHDCYVKNPRWLQFLASHVAENYDTGTRAYGRIQQHGLRDAIGVADPRNWFRVGAWWQNRMLKTAQGVEAPNGDKIFYFSGSFFALSVEAARRGDMPDSRITHWGGEICLGEQLHQLGFTCRTFDKERSYVQAPQRELSSWPGSLPWY